MPLNNRKMDQEIQKDDEIDLLALLLKIWDGRRTILKYFIIFLFIGIFVAIFSKKEYTATSLVLAQESGSSSGGGLSGLASLAGINLGSSSGELISPKLYTSIATSIPFQRKMTQVSIQTSKDSAPITYEQYCQKYQKAGVLDVVKKYTIGLPGVIIGAFSSKDKEVVPQPTADGALEVYSVTPEEKELFSLLSSQLQITNNEKDNTISFSFSMEDPVAAAQMLSQAKKTLQETIIEFKTRKAKSQLEFIKKQYEEAEKNFKEKQLRLAAFQDSNRGLITAVPMTRQTQLQAEYSLANNVYIELAKQLENQKIKLQEDTPAFIDIEPVSIPLEKSKPRRGMIIAIWGFLGMVIGIGTILGRDFIKSIKNKSTSQEEV
jgi:hypothetical protein